MKILITGSEGMVGRNILSDPRFGGWALLCPRRDELDLFDFPKLRHYLEAQQPDVVIHCAGKVGGIEANRRANSAFLTENALLGLHVIEAARAARIPRLLNLASSCMYPKDREGGLAVEDLLTGPLEPTNEGYALAKILAWKLTQFVSSEDPVLSYKTIIPCNLYGPWDKFDPLNGHLIPSIIRKAHEARTNRTNTLEIWGDGSARREFMYIGDLVAFIHHGLDHWDDLPGTLNVGYGTDPSVLDYCRMVCEVVGVAPEFQFDLARPSGMRRKLMDSHQAFTLGWRPEVQPLEGIRRTYQHFLEQLT
jgi:GDP-L-fucose synthase